MNSKIYIYPTDTVWGIGGDIFEPECYEMISKVKNTRSEKPLSILFSSLDQLKDYVELDEKLLMLVEEIFQLGVSVGVRKSQFKKELPLEPFKSTNYVCFRVLESEFMRGLEQIMNFPVTTTSLNISGQEPIVDIHEAKDFWQKHIPSAEFIEAQNQQILSGMSSTIVLFFENHFKVAREGKNLDEILNVVEKYGFTKK